MRRCFLLIFCVFTAASVAQPAHVTRVLRTIDFEERRLGNEEDLPMNWVKVEAPGFPHYVNGKLTSERSRSADHSFRFDLNGGSLLYRYDPRQIKVTPGASYRVEAYVQTTPLEHARARVSAYYVDDFSQPVLNSVRHSELHAAAGPIEPWFKLGFDLPAAPPEAAHIVLELELLQPQVFAGSTLGQRTLHPQDIHGSAWFDDITISQIPRVRLVTDRPGNVFRRADAMALTMDVTDAFIEDLAAQLFVRDASGRTVYQHTSGASRLIQDNTHSTHERLVFPLPALPPGWYEVVVGLSSQGQPLDVQTLNVVRLPDDSAPPLPDPRFGLIATDVPFENWSSLAALLPPLGVGRVKLGIWTRTADAARLDPAAFDTGLARLHNLYIHPTACLLDLPPAIAGKFPGVIPTPGASWLSILKSTNEAEWQGPLEDLIARHAPHLDRWQLGPDGTDAFATLPGMRDAYAKVLAEFSTLLRQPDLAMPWPASYELDGKLPATVALSVPASVLPNQLPLYMQDLKGSESHHLSLSLQLLDRERYGRDVQVRDLAQRIVFALAAGADRIDIPAPFTTTRSTDDGTPAEQPQDLYPIVHTLFTTLGQARYVGRVPVAENVEAFLFDRAGSGILALWDTGRSPGVRQLPINLGESPRLTDLYGHDIPLVRTADDPATGTVNLPVGIMPVFLSNIDGPMAQLRASVALDRPLIESTFAAHSRRLRFKNSYPMTITGSLKLKPPTGWTITPSILDFTLAPGEAFEREISIEFPLSTTAGNRTIDLDCFLQADKATRFRMPLPIKLGLSDVGMQTMALRDGDVVIIQQIIQNYGDKPIDYTAFALLPGAQRQERLITALRPGESTIKRFRFTDVKPSPGLKVRVGLKELDGPRLLNDEVEIP